MISKPLIFSNPTYSKNILRNAAGILGFVGAVALVFWVSNAVGKRELKAQTGTIQRAIDIHSLGLRSDVAKFSTVPYIAAQQQEVVAALLTNDDQAIRLNANRYLEDVNLRAGSDALYVMNLKGMTIAASNWESPKSFVGQNYGNRPYFMDAINGKTGFFYGIGQTTAIPGFFIAVPVYQVGTIVGAVVIKVSFRDIEAAWNDLAEPIMVSDKRGVFFLGSVPSWKYHAKRSVAKDELEWIRRHKQYADRQEFAKVPWEIESLENQSGYLVKANVDGRTRRYIAVDEKLPDLGWTLTIMGDYEPVAWARTLTFIICTLGLGVFALGGLYWQLRERRLIEHRIARQLLEVRVKERTLELDEAHAFQKSMEDSLLIGMRARDLSGCIIYVNAALCEMTGYSKNDLIGQYPPYPYWYREDLARHWSDNEIAMSGNAALSGFESRIKHRNGHEVFTMVYTAPLVDALGKQKGWISSVVDITEQKKAEARQRLHDAQLQHTGRLASMGEMASTLAHELNQPLMALSNFASAANTFAKEGNQALLLNSLQEITKQAYRSADIVKRIRGFVRPATTGVEACQMGTVVKNVLALLEPEIKLQQTRVVCNIEDNLPNVSGDRILLEQVVLNLVMNSLQAMRDTPRDKRYIELETLFIEKSVYVRVTDCGTGISPEIAQQLFEPFFTTKPEGLGLGLNICRTIVESHKGQLSFENRSTKGAVFTLKLQALI